MARTEFDVDAVGSAKMRTPRFQGKFALVIGGDLGIIFGKTMRLSLLMVV